MDEPSIGSDLVPFELIESRLHFAGLELAKKTEVDIVDNLSFVEKAACSNVGRDPAGVDISVPDGELPLGV